MKTISKIQRGISRALRRFEVGIFHSKVITIKVDDDRDDRQREHNGEIDSLWSCTEEVKEESTPVSDK